MLISTWSPGDKVQADLLLVRKADYELLHIAVEDGDVIYRDIKIVLAPPEADLAGVLFYLYWSADEAKLDDRSISDDGRDYFLWWPHYLEAIKSLDLHQAKTLLRKLKSQDSSKYLLWKSNYFAEMLYRWAEIVNNLFFYGSPIGFVGLNNRSRGDWWTNRPIALDSINEYIAELEQVHDVPLSKPVEHLKNNAATLCKFLVSWGENRRGKRMFFVASYFFGLAKMCLDKYRYTEVVMYCHRALENYYLQWCKQEGVVRETSSGFQFSDPMRNSDFPTLIKMEEYLARQSEWVGSNERSKNISRLNKSRNLCKLAHGIFFASREEALIAISIVEKVLSDVEGNYWPELVSAFHLRIEIRPNDLFDVEDGYCEYLQNVTV